MKTQHLLIVAAGAILSLGSIHAAAQTPGVNANYRSGSAPGKTNAAPSQASTYPSNAAYAGSKNVPPATSRAGTTYGGAGDTVSADGVSVCAWFLQAGASVLVVSPEESDDVTLGGGAIEGGVILDQHHRISLEIGAYFREEDRYLRYGSFNEFSFTQSYTAVPVLLNYSYLFTFGNLPISLRVGPTLGCVFIDEQIDAGNSSYGDSDVVFMCGANVGFNWQFADKWSLDATYRFMGTTGASFDFGEIGAVDTGMMLVHQFTISVGMRF